MTVRLILTKTMKKLLCIFIVISFANCKSTSSSRVKILGEYLEKDILPKQACRLQYYDKRKRPLHICSATLISPMHILTAAHCEEDPNVVATQVICNNGEARIKAKRLVHRFYRPGKPEFDLAVLTLDKPIDLEPMRLVHSKEETWELLKMHYELRRQKKTGNCAIIGWGFDNTGKYGNIHGAEAIFDSFQSFKHEENFERMVAILERNKAFEGDSGGFLGCLDNNNKWANWGAHTRQEYTKHKFGSRTYLFAC